MKYYAVAELDVIDRSWVESYLANVTPMVERHGGRYLARTSNFEILEGDRPRPQIVLLVEWPSRGAAETFYRSEEYAPFREARIAGARNQFFLVPGEDIAKRATISG